MQYYQKYLVPTDFSHQCSNAAQRAKFLAKLSVGEITLLHVLNYVPPNYIAVELPGEFGSKERMLEKAQQRMDQWASENGLGDCNTIVETGQPKRVITEQAEKIHADVVVLAPNTESRLVRFFGSVTNAVIQSVDCDVIVVREKQK